MLRPLPRNRAAFTLVELLVVIAIILLMLALLLPAIQKVRESANKLTCASRLRNIGHAVQLYLASNGQLFPTGGGDNPHPRTLNSAGMPALRLEQDWGWMYQILPYLEQDSLWRLRITNPPVPSYYSSYGTDPSGDSQIVQATVETYFCPSRRGPQALKTENGLRGMNDFAGNIGAFTLYLEGGVYHNACADAMGYEPNKPKNPFRNGVFVKSRYFKDEKNAKANAVDEAIHVRDISDGLAHTLLAADKRMNAGMLNVTQFGDTDGFTAGFIADTLRSGFMPPARDFSSEFDLSTDRFGSAHPTSINALFCDGSVRTISYNISESRAVCQVYNSLLAVWGIYPLPDGPPKPTVPYAGPYPQYCIELTLFQRLCHRCDGAKLDMTLLDD